MVFTLWIYTYAILLIISSCFSFYKAKRLVQQPSTSENRHRIFATPQRISQKVIKKTGTTVQVTGQEKIPEGAVLYVANHQGLFDILAFLGHLGKPVGFIAKKEIKKLPIISNWMGLLHCVFIDRADRRQSVKAINQGIENLKNGHSLVIFPEGTRSRGAELNSFKPGSLRLATKANVPIVPVTIDGTYKMLEEDNGRIKGSAIKLMIHDPIFPETYQELKSNELALEIQEIVQLPLKEIYHSSEEGLESEVVIGAH
ncbi:lysophospholipid acyltransferase family protein [Ornithinibacillus contaminans]|uniref:lysophospholipid acyltransferase family protein n=1 Tax=Ornithinibacillus contaminans TaxID=694055 RepID=UPI00064D9DC1|nr:lysophospholipid acyltransferase family protein [Ornithinibacillus contaminans]